MTPLWRVRLFDGPILADAEGRETPRFRSAKVQGLLAFLALRLGKRCPREAIADALWPDESDSAVTANRLRVTLASLRRQIEPSGTPYGTVLDASVPGFVVLREETVWCDFVAFERAYAAGRREEAGSLLRGPLLPGLYDEWVRDEQIRIEILRDELGDFARPTVDAERMAAPPVEIHHLPLYLTRFIGREDERRRLRERLTESRLVTLSGPGGIGKTRLAVEAAGESNIPAVFVSLIGAHGPSDVAEAVLKAFGISSRTADEPVEQLLRAVRERPPTLVILDNAEENVEAVADLAPRLLAAAPGLRTLVTSRQRLEIPGEVVVAVPPLAAPPEATDLESLPTFPSAALFLDRARESVPDFALRERHLEPVIAICRRLEGMPLALELAAARVAVQSPVGIAAALEANVMDLRSRQRGLSERHRSLRAAIQGSFEILSPELQRFFARLSAFRGGWTAQAAVAVCDEPLAEEQLEELLVRSLVTAAEDQAGAGVRYAFLEPLRAFASERLADSAACRHRHAAYYLALASVATEDDLRTLGMLDAEEENLRLALEAGRETPEFWPGLAGSLIHAFVRGRHRQAIRWIEATSIDVAAAESPDARFRYRYAACQILPDVGQLEAADALALAMQKDADATGDALGSVHAAVIRAYVEEQQGELDKSLAISAHALTRARELGDRHLLETCLSHRSGALHVQGAVLGPTAAVGGAALAEAEALARELRSLVPSHSRRLALAPLLLAAALWPQGRLAEAYGFFKEAQIAAVRLGTTTELMYALVSEAVIAAEWGFAEHAARIYGGFGAVQERMGYSLARAQSSRPPWIESLAEELRARLGEATFARLVAIGRETSPAVLAAQRVSPPATASE